MSSPEKLQPSDPAAVTRYLQVRTLLHDRCLARVERMILERYDVEPTHRLPATLTAEHRGGFVRPDEGEIWPVVFLTAADVFVALCVQISPERVAGLGTQLNGPQRLRHRHWEDWWGWETPLAGVHPRFFDMGAAQQDEAIAVWYARGLEWLANSGLLRRKRGERGT